MRKPQEYRNHPDRKAADAAFERFCKTLERHRAGNRHIEVPEKTVADGRKARKIHRRAKAVGMTRAPFRTWLRMGAGTGQPARMTPAVARKQVPPRGA